MAELFVLRHRLESCVKLIADGCGKVGCADFPVHLVLEAVKEGAGLFVHLKLEINKKVHIFVLFFRVLFHKPGKRLSLNILGNEGPFSVNHCNLKNLRNEKPRFLNARLIERLVQHVCF